MNIREFSLNLQKVYEEMGETFITYQASTGLACLSGCGRCCLNPEIEASVGEMIPWALKVFDEGKADEWLEKLNSPEQDHCLLFQSEGEGRGKCGSYQERPSVCRMFGVAGYFDKHHAITLSVCKYIQEATPALLEKVRSNPTEGTPVIAQWATKVASLDPSMMEQKRPINTALRGALEKVALFAMYDT